MAHPHPSTTTDTNPTTAITRATKATLAEPRSCDNRYRRSFATGRKRGCGGGGGASSERRLVRRRVEGQRGIGRRLREREAVGEQE
eukprot:26251-Eustigmatos_ZCMA.PRE.1